MTRIEKTVFISYRRVDRWPALAVFKNLTQHGYDVFIDYDGIASGNFEGAIVDNIRNRAHFVVVLTPTALERCDDPTDWLRREIEVALEARRNIVPLLFDGFKLDAPIAIQRLQGSLEPLRKYQALKVPEDFFDAAMERLRSKYLAIAVETVLHPASAHAQRVAHEQFDAASKAKDDPPPSSAAAPHSINVFMDNPNAATRPPAGERIVSNSGGALPADVLSKIRARAERDYPDDFSTRKYVIDNEVRSWQRLQSFAASGVPNDVLETVLREAEQQYPDDFSTRLYLANNEVNAWRELQALEVPGMPADTFTGIVNKAERDFPRDFSTRLYVIKNEIAAWRDLYS